MRTGAYVITGLAGLALALVACQSTPLGNGSGCASINPVAWIVIGDNGGWKRKTPTGLDTGVVDVNVNDVVCFENTGSIRHVMQGDFNASADTSWMSAYDLEPGFIRVVQFAQPSNYTYHCTLHTGEAGEIDVR